MFFGLCNSPSTFQAMMNDTLKDEIEEGLYMDNILIFAKNKEDLECFTKCILNSLWKADLYLKPSKCEFCKTKIEYLGLIIKEGKMMMDPMKLNGICNWPIPKNIKQVHSFLGFGNFYWHFIQKFSKLTQLLNKLLQKDQPFIWDDAAQKAFDEMKKHFTEEPVLMMPDQTWPFQIECDASKYASGAYATWRQWWSTPMCLHIADLLSNRTELQDLWLQTFICDLSPSRMVTLYSRISTWNDNLFRPQEPHIFPKCPETELMTSPMVPPFIWIWH